MSLSIRQHTVTQAGLNQALSSINPIKPGERVEIYACADAAGDSLVASIGTKQIVTADLGVENGTGFGPVVPDNLIAKWQQPPQMGNQDLSIVITGDAIDIMIIKS